MIRLIPIDRDGDRLDDDSLEIPFFRARTTAGKDGVLKCTIFPGDVRNEKRTSRWITAEEGGYVDLDQVR